MFKLVSCEPGASMSLESLVKEKIPEDTDDCEGGYTGSSTYKVHDSRDTAHRVPQLIIRDWNLTGLVKRLVI